MRNQSSTQFLNDLLEVVFHNSIYFIPSELITNVVLEKLGNEVPSNFLNNLLLLDINKGAYHFESEDALEINERLLNKRQLLEDNIFILLEKNDYYTELQFEGIIQKYHDQLLFFLYLYVWLMENINKYYTKELHIAIEGAIKLQPEILNSHLKDVYSYFGDLIYTERQYDFTLEKIVLEHLPELISRYNQIGSTKVTKSIDEIEISESDELVVQDLQINKKVITKKKKQRPEISEPEIERMLLESIFKIRFDS